MPLTEADALYGAAWKVCYERSDPDASTNELERARTAASLGEVAKWAHAQSPEVCAAYRRAVTDISIRADQVLENNVRARQQQAAFEAIPKPPGPAA